MGRKKRTSEETVSGLAQVLGELRGSDLPPGALKRHLESLLDHRDRAIPLLLGLFESEDEDRLAFATAALKAMNDPSLVPALVGMLRSPDVGALAKGLLLKLLEHYGADTCDPSLIGASIDVGSVLREPAAPQGM